LYHFSGPIAAEYQQNLRILSTFYPSIVHTSKNFRENTTTFTFVELAPRINILEFKKSPDGLIMQNNLLFFLWFKNNQLTQKSHLVVFPIYWDFSSPRRESSTLIPLYSYGSYANKTKKYLAITPLYWNLESQKRTTNILLPVWWNRAIRTNYDTVRNNTLFPIYYSHSDRLQNNRCYFLLCGVLEIPDTHRLPLLRWYRLGTESKLTKVI
jgi:hypothetical protein